VEHHLIVRQNALKSIIMNRYFLLLTGCLFFSCKPFSPSIEEVLQQADSNRGELEKVLAHYGQYPADSLKFKAAIFLIENLPGHYSYRGNGIEDYYEKTLPVLYSTLNTQRKKDSLERIAEQFPSLEADTIEDCKIITANFLIQNIERAFADWEYPWARHLSFDQFCEYLLPYKVLELQQMDAWRDTLAVYCGYNLRETPSNDETDRSTYHAAKTANAEIRRHIRYRSLWGNEPFLGYSFLSAQTMHKIPFGLCDDYTALGALALRSVGIAAYMEYVPLWGRREVGHSWYGFISDNGAEYISDYDFTSDFNGTGFPMRDIPKVYRRTYSRNPMASEYYAHTRKPHPSVNLFQVDVTDRYVATSDVSIPVHKGARQYRYAHICLFNGRHWEPVDFGRIDNRKVHFMNMGRNLLYLGMVYDGKNLLPVTDPFILHGDGRMEVLTPDTSTSHTVRLKRKYPTTLHVVEMQRRVIGSKIQASADPNFEHAVTLSVIDSEDYPGLIPLPDSGEFRYWRYVSLSEAEGNLAELQFYAPRDTTIQRGEIIGSESRGDTHRDKAFDGNWLTHFRSRTPEPWVGMDFHRPCRMDRVRVVPRSDDNDIHPGDKYELKYWNQGQWVSLGVRTGDERYLEYANVPANALLLLSNLTRGKQERIFTWHHGRQIFW
jgi:hypothetical protein